MAEVLVSQTISLPSPVLFLHDFSVLALLPYYHSIILISLPSPFRVFFLTIIPSIKPGWPPTYCWRAPLVSGRVYCWVPGGGWALAAEGDPQSNRGATLHFSLLSLGQECQTEWFWTDSTWIQIQEFFMLYCITLVDNKINHWLSSIIIWVISTDVSQLECSLYEL